MVSTWVLYFNHCLAILIKFDYLFLLSFLPLFQKGTTPTAKCCRGQKSPLVFQCRRYDEDCQIVAETTSHHHTYYIQWMVLAFYRIMRCMTFPMRKVRSSDKYFLQTDTILVTIFFCKLCVIFPIISLNTGMVHFANIDR